MVIFKLWHTEPDFWKTYFSGRKCRKYAGKTSFLAFSQDFIISFFWFFCTKMHISNMPKTWPSPILEKIFSRSKIARNIPKIICRKSPLLQIFIELFPCISLFFRTKLTIKHGSIVNKTDFWSLNLLNFAETADFRRKTVFLEFFERYFIFFHEILHTDAKRQYLKFFSKNCRNKPFDVPEKQVGPISIQLVISFLCTQNSTFWYQCVIWLYSN